ncbi:MAG: STAS domain-containing protein [Fibrobacteria bacterium]|nr:STAS domain-containing protein [Fibrobacteria bacterium]
MATLTLINRGNWIVVRVVGEIQTFADAASLKAVLFERISRGESRIAVDLSGVDYIGSSGIGVFAQAQQELSRVGSSLVLVRARNEVRHLMEIVNLDRLVVFADTEAELDRL